MIFKVLGCYGGELPGFRCPGFLVNGRLLLEAGTAAFALTLEEQLGLTAVCVSHVHLDHVKDLPFLVENRAGRGLRPLVVAATARIVACLQRDLFNGRLWPDFSRIPSRREPSLRYQALPEGRFSRVAGIGIKPVRVRHTVDATGYLLREPGASILYTGDTGPTPDVWKAAHRLRDLRAVIAECSFPSSMEALAVASGHLTPTLLERGLALLDRPEVPVHLCHMKPLYLTAIAGELARLSRRATMLRQGRTYAFSREDA